MVETVVVPALGWWLLAQLFGVATLAICTRFFGWLPDRGLNVAKPFGLLLVGYLFWLGGSIRLLPPDRGPLVILLVGLGLLGLAISGRSIGDAGTWLRSNWRLVLPGELLFLVLLVGWAIVRSYNPELIGTEKPMELAFLNSVLRAEAFPPNDPWLSGSSISYYYFGYVLVGMMAKLAATPAAVAFNLAVALVMALAAQAAFGIVVNLGALRGRHGARLIAPAVAAGLILVLMGNLVGALDGLRAKGVGDAAFWQRVAIDGMVAVPQAGPEWYPLDNWWWWKATRVINTFVGGQGIDYTISEFPIFSFVLADLHPHVIGLPFNLLAITVALAAFTSPLPWGFGWLRENAWRGVVAAILIGGLGFLNPWDLPAFAFLLFAAVAVRAYQKAGRVDGLLLRDVGLFAGLVGAACILLYVPFYRGFSTQASGIRPVLGVATQPQHFLLFWGPLLALAIGFVAVRLPAGWRNSATTAIAFGVAPIVAWLLLTAPAAYRAGTLDLYLGTLPAKLGIALAIGLLVAIGALVALRSVGSDGFAGLLIATGFVLVLGAELFYIVDVFNSRMNTVFKFYYQAWAMLAVVAGVALGALWPTDRVQWGRAAWLAVCLVLIGAGAYYGVAATYSKADRFIGEPTLDGLAFARLANADEDAAIRWLANRPANPVVVEAVGGQYSEFARVSTRTGLPTILGWPGHERQWRGSDAPFAGREAMVDAIYANADPNAAVEMLRSLKATYVYVGALERQKYGAVPDRLAGVLDVAYKNLTVTIYQVR